MKRFFTSLCVCVALSFAGAAVASAQAITYFNEDFSSITAGNNTSTSGSNSSWSSNENFSNTSSVYQAGGAIKLGASKASGSITTKTLNLSQNGGNFVVEFDVKGWSSVEGQIKVTVTGQDDRNVTYGAKMTDSFENIKLYYTGGKENSTVTIATSAKRAFLDNIKVYPAYQVQMGEDKHATIATALPYILPTGLTGCTVSVENGKAQITEALQANDIVAAEQGILLKGEKADYYLQIAGTEGAKDVKSTNALKPALNNDPISAPGKKLYILANDETDGLGFYFQGSTNGASVSGIAGKAYLEVNENEAPTQGFSFSGIVSSIEAAALVAPAKNEIYDLSGRRVSTPAKGLYIVNGKKVIR